MTMPRGGADQGKPVTAATLRAKAMRARRLADHLTDEADRQAFLTMADELEAQAAELERGGE